jgi:hypothetical protein
MSDGKGPHVPVMTVAGHFLSMQPSTDAKLGPEKVWYRGDAYRELYDQMATFRQACEDVMKYVAREADPEVVTIIDIIEKATG